MHPILDAIFTPAHCAVATAFVDAVAARAHTQITGIHPAEHVAINVTCNYVKGLVAEVFHRVNPGANS